MDKFLIKGPSKVRGKVSIPGSKNASIPILAATILFDKKVIIKNLPRVKDVDTLISLLKSLGSKITLSKDKKTAKIINPKKRMPHFGETLGNSEKYLVAPQPQALCFLKDHCSNLKNHYKKVIFLMKKAFFSKSFRLRHKLVEISSKILLFLTF